MEKNFEKTCFNYGKRDYLQSKAGVDTNSLERKIKKCIQHNLRKNDKQESN